MYNGDHQLSECGFRELVIMSSVSLFFCVGVVFCLV